MEPDFEGDEFSDEGEIIDSFILDENDAAERIELGGEEDGAEMSGNFEGIEIDDGAQDEEGETETRDDSIKRYSVHNDPIYSIAINVHKPGMFATGGGDDKAFILSTTEADKRIELAGHTDSVSWVSFIFDGQYLATSSLDGTVKIWKTEDGTLVSTLEGPSEGLEWVRWHPRGDNLLAGTQEGSVWMWTRTGKCLNVFTGHKGVVGCGAFTPNGKRIVTAGDDSTLRVWHPESGLESTVIGHPFHKEGAINDISFHPNSTLVLTGGSDAGVKMVNLTTGKVVASLDGHKEEVQTVGISEKYGMAFSGSGEGSLRIWNLDNLQLRATADIGCNISKGVWHPTEPLLFTSSVDGVIRLWDARAMKDGKCEREWHGHTEPIQAFDVTPDGKFIISGGEDKTALLFEYK